MSLLSLHQSTDASQQSVFLDEFIYQIHVGRIDLDIFRDDGGNLYPGIELLYHDASIRRVLCVARELLKQGRTPEVCLDKRSDGTVVLILFRIKTASPRLLRKLMTRRDRVAYGARIAKHTELVVIVAGLVPEERAGQIERFVARYTDMKTLFLRIVLSFGRLTKPLWRTQLSKLVQGSPPAWNIDVGRIDGRSLESMGEGKIP